VDQSIREACHEAIYEHCFLGDRIPADILLLGGDDLLVYTSAEAALPFAVSAARKFTEKTQRRFSTDPFFSDMLKGKGLTISLGIAYGRSHSPFSILLDQAEELLKSAKKAGASDPRSEEFFVPTYVDYHLTSHFNQVLVEDCRKNHLELPGQESLLLYQKPYCLEDIQALLEHARNLVRVKIPRTRLKRLGYAPSLGKTNATLECLKVYMRTRNKDHRLAIWQALGHFGCMGDTIPWRQEDSGDSRHYTTVLMDLIELTEFMV
jgi:hypothetical protein